ncbi:MAG: DNA helicase, partial [Sneathiella sp.]
MKLSAPIFRLKRQARQLSRTAKIPLNQALDELAKKEGFQNWSLLAARISPAQPNATIYRQLEAGDMVLLAARPGHGKTLLGLELIIEAVKAGNRGVFYTLEYTEDDIHSHFQSLGHHQPTEKAVTLDTSDDINADHIINTLDKAAKGTLIVVDYLQLLDQKRENPVLSDQIDALKSFAKTKGLILVFISQIDRSYDRSQNLFPDLADIRLPNPVDLTLFDKACLLNDGEIRL